MFRQFAVLIAASLIVTVVAFSAEADQSQVRIELTGIILPVCVSTGNSANLALDRLDRGGDTTMAFTVDCNAPFQYRVESLNGGFSLSAAVSPSNAFATLVPYTVAVNIPLDGGAIADRCQSMQIKSDAFSCALSSSGEKVAIAKRGSVNVSWTRLPKALLSGSYRDRLTISFSIRP